MSTEDQKNKTRQDTIVIKGSAADGSDDIRCTKVHEISSFAPEYGACKSILPFQEINEDVQFKAFANALDELHYRAEHETDTEAQKKLTSDSLALWRIYMHLRAARMAEINATGERHE